MQNSAPTIINQMMAIDAAHLESGKLYGKIECRTRVILDNFYLCQANRSDCVNAFPFGYCYLCNSPMRKDYSS
jgi:hypothetical protein